MSPTRLNQLPEKQWLTQRFTPLWVPEPPYAEQNKLLFVYYRGIRMNLWNRNCQSLFGYTGFIIYSNLNLLFWLAKSLPIILSRCYRLYWWYPLRPKLISVSLSVSLIPAVYDGPVVTNISFGKCCDVRFTVFMRFLALSVFDALFIAACELSVQLVLTLVWMRFCWSYRAADHLHRFYEPSIVNYNFSVGYIWEKPMQIIKIHLYIQVVDTLY